MNVPPSPGGAAGLRSVAWLSRVGSRCAGLRQAIEAEFAGDPARLAIARRHVEQAAQRGQPAVAAVVALDRMVEVSRAGRYTLVYNGPVTIDDEILALVAKLQRCECPCHAAGHDREVVG